MRKDLVLAGQGSGRNLRNHESGVQAGIIRKESRQIAVLGIEQPFNPPFGDVGQHRKSNRHEVESETQRLAVKVPARNYVGRICVHERIVGCAVQLH